MEKKKAMNFNWVSVPLTVLFIVLKLMGVIQWSWWWVLSPLWISFCLAVALLVVIGIVYFIYKRCEK